MLHGLLCRLGDRLPMSSVYFRHFRLCQLEFKNTALLKFGNSKLEYSKIGIAFLFSMSSALPSSKNSKFENRDLIQRFVLLQVLPIRLQSIHRFGILLGWSWERFGMLLETTPVITYTQSQVDHLFKIFQCEVDHLLQNEVDQESKKIRLTTSFKKIQVDHGFKNFLIISLN